MSSPRHSRVERNRRRAISAIFVLALLLSWSVGFDPLALFSSKGIASAADLGSGLASPDLSPTFLARVANLAWESLLIGVLGTALAGIFGLGVGYIATRAPDLGYQRSRVHRMIESGSRGFARLLLATTRSVPEIVWAYLFVRIVGLGPGAAVFAIALTFGGIMGKLFAELAEDADPRAALELRASGASRFAAFVYGVVPIVRRKWLGYALFRLECAIRSASVLGVVGAGGLGAEIELSIRYFQYDKLATTLLVVLAFIAALEVGSWFLRRAPARFALALFALGSLVAITSLPIPWSALVSGDAATQARRFFADFASPTHSSAFITESLFLVFETVAIAFVATAIAAAIALFAAPVTSRAWWRGALDDGPRQPKPTVAVAFAISATFRIVLQIARAIPDLVWALVAVAAVGPGATAGIIALSIHTTGVLGRLFSDVFEEASLAPRRDLEIAGASKLARFFYGLLPTSSRHLAAFALFRFEVNVRAAAMIGFVGAGGLGDAIHTAISLFHGSDLATLILILFATVALIDAAGDRLRQVGRRSEAQLG